MIDLEMLQRQLKAHGLKLTRQRRAVLRVVTTTNGRLDAAKVCEDAKAECPEIGLTTVYRTLEILAEMGALRRLHLPDGCSTYAPASPGHRHHLVCLQCGKAVEFEGCDLAAFLDSVASQTGFEVEDHWLQLLGRCPTCRRTQRRL
ncbi:MAG: transcriptional repressor [Firmicutes bacterium]|jgi:Fur family ferric uptake transcriptional regulator|nr:transcriptional repressor [Bacillota bacterium]MDH7495792.1 Fur family transcriptional regulator [Bacillota bacterium]